MPQKSRRPRSGRIRSIANGVRNRPLPARPSRRCRRAANPRQESAMSWNDYLNTFLFGVYPYICLTVLLLGSLIRLDREPYTWKSDSSQLLRRGQLRLGSNLFHAGVIVVVLGHFAGFLAPEWAVEWAINPAQHQLIAMVAGGIAGLIAIIGLTMLIVRR